MKADPLRSQEPGRPASASCGEKGHSPGQPEETMQGRYARDPARTAAGICDLCVWMGSVPHLSQGGRQPKPGPDQGRGVRMKACQAMGISPSSEQRLRIGQGHGRKEPRSNYVAVFREIRQGFFGTGCPLENNSNYTVCVALEEQGRGGGLCVSVRSKAEGRRFMRYHKATG